MFKVGDSIRIKDKFWEINGNVVATSKMYKYAGKPYEIEDIYGGCRNLVKLKGIKEGNGGDGWTWDASWLEIDRWSKRIERMRNV